MIPSPANGYAYTIVGCGFYGAVFARLMAEAGYACMLVDRRPHIGGNCYTRQVHGINVHEYGPHIFHTNDRGIWQFVNRFAEFNRFTLRTAVRNGNRLFSFPINLLTFHQLWGVMTPAEVEARLAKERIPCDQPNNCEDWILSQVGRELYETFFYGYTSKQWNRSPRDLPASIVRRIPIRLEYNDRYFNDTYEGIPVGGYTALFENLLDHPLIKVELNVDYFAHARELKQSCQTLVYTGRIDEFFDFRFGRLEYRSLRFEHETIDGVHQGNAIINYTDKEVPYTRITEHKYFDLQGDLPKSVITREYPQTYEEGKIPYYPVRDAENAAIHERYQQYAAGQDVLFGGRLGTYRYYDMHQVVAQAMADAKKCLGERWIAAESLRKAA